MVYKARPVPGTTLLPLPELPASVFAVSQRRSSHQRPSLPGDSGSTYCSSTVSPRACRSLPEESRHNLHQRTVCVGIRQHAPGAGRLTQSVVPQCLLETGRACAPGAFTPATHLLATSQTAQQSCHPSQHSADLASYYFTLTN